MGTNAKGGIQATGRFIVLAACVVSAVWGLGWGAWRIAAEGVGVLGVNNDVPWGWDVALFVFWIGLGHAGTLISAVLLLTGKPWRKEISRHAEWMTLCAVSTAAVFPLIHVGRAWMAWQMSPIPLPSGVWPNLASPLAWDAAAIGSYFLLSFLFLLTGIIGERQQHPQTKAIWARTCLLMAGILTPLVVTVHSVVGSDFAVLLRWNDAIMPPYFVCGALLSGMAAVQLIAICRRCPPGVIGKLAQLTLALGGAMGLFYGMELLRHPDIWDHAYAGMLLLNIALPALYAFPSLRRNRWVTAVISLGILGGMWLERVQIIIARSILETGGTYHPTDVDAALMAGSIGLFLSLFLGFSKRLSPERVDPLEIRAITPPTSPVQWALGGAAAGAGAVLLWAACTQSADTAGILSGRPHGFPYHLPALFVSALLGAGLALFANFLRSLKA